MLDTDISSDIIKGRSPKVEAELSALEPSMVCVSAMTRAELLYGLKRLPPEHRLHVGVKRFLKIVRVLSWDAEAAEFYAEIRHHLMTTGQQIGELDMMIAAHSLSAAAFLVTNNTSLYARIRSPLIIQNWA
jgi:tRNA(fMet)-specific endonuclease VapC